MSPSEARAENFLKAAGLSVEKRQEGDEKNPDLSVTSDDGFHFLAEVKAIEGPGEDEAMTWAQLYNSITRDIRHSVKQFDAVNSRRFVPNVLIIVGEDFRVHGKSFLDFMNAEIVVEGQVIADLTRYRFGRVKEAFSRIDLLIVLDTCDTPTYFFADNFRDFTRKLTRIFGLDAGGD